MNSKMNLLITDLQLIDLFLMEEQKPAFSFFWMTDRNPLSGHVKKRRIANPNRAMRTVHARLLHGFRQLGIKLPSATGGITGSSPLKNLDYHRRKRGDKHRFNRYFYLLDLKNAFPSIDNEKLIEIVASLFPQELNEVVTRILNMYCLSTRDKIKGLIVGAPASPYLFNLYCEVMVDQQLRALCEQYQLSYSRYLDDFAFSSTQPIGEHKRRMIREIIMNAGFLINHKKCQVYDLSKGSVIINGIGVRRNGDTYLPRHAVVQLRGLMHQALNGQPVDWAVIFGKMGLFIHLTDVYHPNAIESKLLDQYYEFRMMVKEALATY